MNAYPVKLEVETLRSGSVYVRPAGALGTCGWSPKAWTIARVDRRRRFDPVAAFLAANPNWNKSEVTA